MDDINYWVFQANPKYYRIEDGLCFLLTNDMPQFNWMVNQHRKRINKGDAVIIWVCGKNAGVYALATVTSPVHMLSDKDDPFYIDRSKSDERPRVLLRIDENFVQNPILKSQILAAPFSKQLPQGYIGTNLRADYEH